MPALFLYFSFLPNDEADTFDVLIGSKLHSYNRLSTLSCRKVACCRFWDAQTFPLVTEPVEGITGIHK